MASNFIPPIPIGQFKPSSEAIASWLYEVWKYLQENPIPAAEDVSSEAASVAQNYIATNVPQMIASAIAALQYSDFVNGTTLPVYRASNDEIDNTDLLEAWADGCRFALVDDEAFFIMIKDGETVNLLQVLTEEQSHGVISVNGQTGNVILTTSDLSNTSGYINSSSSALARAIWIDFPAFSSLPQTVNNALITDKHRPVYWKFSNPRAQGTFTTVTTSNGSVTVSGSVTEETTLSLLLVQEYTA